MKHASKILALNFFMWALSPLVTLPVLASSTYLVFTPREVSGTVLYWTATGGRWLPVRDGVPIPEKTLVQVGSRSRVVLHIESRSDIRGKGSSVIEASIATPMVFRVERDLVRKMKVNRKAFATAAVQQEADILAMSILGDLAHGHFRDAFRSLAILVRGGEAGAPDETSHGSQDKALDMTEDGDAAPAFATGPRIKLRHPAADARVHLDEFPGYFRIFWEMPDKHQGKDAQVFFWPEGERQGPPVVVTRDTSYNLLVIRPGEYNIQVATPDWAAKSTIKRIFVHADDHVDPADAMSIELTSPPRNFVFVSETKPVRIPFAWELRNVSPEALAEGNTDFMDFEVVIAPDDKGPPREKVYRVAGNGGFGGTSLGASTLLTLNKRGKFVWYVKTAGAESPRYKFTIATPADYLDPGQDRGPGVAVARQAKAGRRAYVYFDKLP